MNKDRSLNSLKTLEPDYDDGKFSSKSRSRNQNALVTSSNSKGGAIDIGFQGKLNGSSSHSTFATEKRSKSGKKRGIKAMQMTPRSD